MKLWILRWAKGEGSWEEARGFVVRAGDEKSARDLAANKCGEEGREHWISPATSTCDELQQDGDPGIVIRDFQYG